jgi:hypothetical protein
VTKYWGPNKQMYIKKKREEQQFETLAWVTTAKR